MKLSIITACKNMENWIEQTLQSIPQDPDLIEYIVVDGLSDDNTLGVIDKFRHKIDHLISEPDDGQYHAIAKGFAASSGEIMCWINADDILMPWTARVVCEIFDQFPEVMWISGTPSFLNAKMQLVQIQSKTAAYPQKFIKNGWYSKNLAGYLQQENMFWRRSLWEQVGGLNTGYRLAADFDLWTRFAAKTGLVSVDVPLAAFRELPGEQISSRLCDVYEQEVADCCKKLPKPNALWRFFSGKNIILANLGRLFIWRKSEMISYSRTAQKWHRFSVFRSISRLSFADLITQFRVRRQK